MSTLDDLIARAERLAAENKALAADLRAFKALQNRTGKGALKHADGKLTERGVAALEASLAAHKTPSEIARQLNISVPAVLYRKRAWEASRKKGARK